MSAYSRAWVTNMFQQGLEFVTSLWDEGKHYNLLDLILSWI